MSPKYVICLVQPCIYMHYGLVQQDKKHKIKVTKIESNYYNIEINLRSLYINIKLLMLLLTQKTHNSLFFSGNKLECNCGFKFINSTFHLNTDLIGTCVKPKALENMKLRRASRLLNERCDENNNIRASKIKKAKQS